MGVFEDLHVNGFKVDLDRSDLVCINFLLSSEHVNIIFSLNCGKKWIEFYNLFIEYTYFRRHKQSLFWNGSPLA